MLKWFFGLSPHIRTAILIAPILTIGGYGLADFFLVGGKESKQETEFIALHKVNECRLAGGSCQLERDGFKAEIKRIPATEPGLIRLQIRSNMAMRGVKLSLVQGSEFMVYMGQTLDTSIWEGEFPEKELETSKAKLRVAIARVGIILHSEVEVYF